MQNQTQNQRPPALGDRRAAQNAAFREKLRQMALPLAPLVQLTTGEIHSAFPGTLLKFWLLTDAELEGLAHFYHQRTPCRWTFHYPCPIAWASDMPLEEKRRRIGRFIGLRGCETPTMATAAPLPSGNGSGGGNVPARSLTEEEILDQARHARFFSNDEEAWRRKFRWYN
ncbi:uncharacterized protein F4812DRAFT_69054 [Daldinia caldariorum]|uniref:uncharacterized protein n=1 Tax=Daldinia caldariorum TaxID=326644 RepID=UPI002007F243|nr:uncharacterized protein F4812DRAFT_69054 [Daldinia caldariorum]KAI1466857.1 hypothetical protein F4812DRAFT_69054 [Daldinia caldariorum]